MLLMLIILFILQKINPKFRSKSSFLFDIYQKILAPTIRLPIPDQKYCDEFFMCYHGIFFNCNAPVSVFAYG